MVIFSLVLVQVVSSVDTLEQQGSIKHLRKFFLGLGLLNGKLADVACAELCAALIVAVVQVVKIFERAHFLVSRLDHLGKRRLLLVFKLCVKCRFVLSFFIFMLIFGVRNFFFHLSLLLGKQRLSIVEGLEMLSFARLLGLVVV